jgi:AmiR/NasT family two-component response regulator
MSKYVKLDIGGSSYEGEKVVLQEFEDVVSEEQLHLIRDLIINNLRLLVQDRYVKESLLDLGYKNIDEAKSVHEKIVLSAKYSIVSKSGYVLSRDIILEKLDQSTLKMIIRGDAYLVQTVNYESLKNVEAVKSEYAKAEKNLNREEKTKKELAAKKAESKKQKEIEKAKKILAEAGEKV